MIFFIFKICACIGLDFISALWNRGGTFLSCHCLSCSLSNQTNSIPHTAHSWKPTCSRCVISAKVYCCLRASFVTKLRLLSPGTQWHERKLAAGNGEGQMKAVPPGWFCCPGFCLSCLSDLCVCASVSVFVNLGVSACQVRCHYRHPSSTLSWLCASWSKYIKPSIKSWIFKMKQKHSLFLLDTIDKEMPAVSV